MRHLLRQISCCYLLFFTYFLLSTRLVDWYHYYCCCCWHCCWLLLPLSLLFCLALSLRPFRLEKLSHVTRVQDKVLLLDAVQCTLYFHLNNIDIYVCRRPWLLDLCAVSTHPLPMPSAGSIQRFRICPKRSKWMSEVFVYIWKITIMKSTPVLLLLSRAIDTIQSTKTSKQKRNGAAATTRALSPKNMLLKQKWLADNSKDRKQKKKRSARRRE